MNELNQLLLDFDLKKNFNDYDYYVSKALSKKHMIISVSEFFDWLGLRSEAVEWFCKHQLPDASPEIADIEQASVYEKELVRSLVGNSPLIARKHSKDYCIFEKGVSL